MFNLNFHRKYLEKTKEFIRDRSFCQNSNYKDLFWYEILPLFLLDYPRNILYPYSVYSSKYDYALYTHFYIFLNDWMDYL